MKLKKDAMDRGLGGFLPQSKKWLLERGYIKPKDEVAGEYEWSEEGYKWINQLKAKTKGSTR